jgi:ParB-like chromosome segregation protein Spo0J
VAEIRIEDVLASPLVDAGAHLDADRVRLYVRAGEDVLPVVVFETEDGLLLVDGYHRVAAAKLRGAETVTADVRRGSRSDALRFAAELAAVQRGISPDLALARIRERSQGRSSAKTEDS